MLSHYFELAVIPQPDRTQTQVINDLMQLLHRSLPRYNNREDGHVAVSFPAYGLDRTLGGMIRLHGTEEHLEELRDDLYRASGYAVMTPVRPLPATIPRHAVFVRRQYKGASAACRLRARYERRQDAEWTDKLASAVAARYGARRSLPFFRLQSGSTGQSMLVFVERRIVAAPQAGFFTGYGLSKPNPDGPLATVPMF